MIVCHCRAVNDAAIRTAVARGARNLDEVARSCGAGKGCGGCAVAITELLDEARPVVKLRSA